MRTHPTLPFGPLPEALWRELAAWACTFDDGTTALDLLSLTMGLGKDRDRQAVDAVGRALREHRTERASMLADNPELDWYADEVAECDALLAALRVAMPRRLSKPQRALLTQIRDATDGTTSMQQSGVSQLRGLCAVGSTVQALRRSGLVVCGGVCCQVDGDGYTVRDESPWWTVTDKGRAALSPSG